MAENFMHDLHEQNGRIRRLIVTTILLKLLMQGYGLMYRQAMPFGTLSECGTRFYQFYFNRNFV
jgi:hypothetical protein